jgi:hypothetical protein
MKAESLLYASLVEYLARSQPIPQDLGLLLLSSFSMT